jgi:hypothetical protein
METLSPFKLFRVSSGAGKLTVEGVTEKSVDKLPGFSKVTAATTPRTIKPAPIKTSGIIWLYFLLMLYPDNPDFLASRMKGIKYFFK